jgi:transcriptional regulator with XRE-family HTH domain
VKKMKMPQDAVSARELFASIRDENPEIAKVERQMGSRLLIARNVLRLRARIGITQTELARRAQMAQPRIAEIEAGGVNTTVDTLDKLAAAFGVDAASLLKSPRVSEGARKEEIITVPRPTDSKGWGSMPRVEVSGRKLEACLTDSNG